MNFSRQPPQESQFAPLGQELDEIPILSRLRAPIQDTCVGCRPDGADRIHPWPIARDSAEADSQKIMDVNDT